MTVPRTMQAIRLHGPGVAGLRHKTIETPSPGPGDVLVEVHAAAITRDELDWPLDRLPAVPSYELSGVVAVAAEAAEVSVGDAVYGLTPFDRDGVAAEYAAVPATHLAPKPASLSHVESAAVPLPAVSAWQGLFDHGRLAPARRCWSTGRSVVSASSRRSWPAGVAPTCSRLRRQTPSARPVRLERTK
jgi:NADPH:quinone reductase-like Zn-dependent oxidoreductase